MHQDGRCIDARAKAQFTDLLEAEFTFVETCMAWIDFNQGIGCRKYCVGVMMGSRKQGEQQVAGAKLGIDGKAGKFADRPASSAQAFYLAGIERF